MGLSKLHKVQHFRKWSSMLCWFHYVTCFIFKQPVKALSLGKALLSVLFSLTITCMAKIGCLKKPVLNIFWLSVIEIKAGLFMMIITCSSARQHRLLTQSTLTSCMSTIFISLTIRIQNKLNNMNESLNVFF